MSWDQAVCPQAPGKEDLGHHARDSQLKGKPWSRFGAPGTFTGSMNNHNKVVGYTVTMQQSIDFLYASNE